MTTYPRIALCTVSFFLAAATYSPALIAQSSIPITQQPGGDHPDVTSYRTIYLTHATELHEANDLQTALRNMLPRARIYYVPSQNALTLRANAEDMALAERMVADLDRPRKLYRLTYTITEKDGTRQLGSQTYTLVITPGTKTELKQGSKIPIMVGMNDANGPGHDSAIQYLDIGWNIDATLDGSSEGLKLSSKVEQSSLAEDKPSSPQQDPVIRQTVLEGSATLTQGKPLILGSLDVPGSTRREEVQVISEPVP